MTEQAPPNETQVESKPQSHGWIHRNRGRIAFVLGMAIGANMVHIGRAGENALRWGRWMAGNYLRNEVGDGRFLRQIKLEAHGISLCEIKEGTFLEEDRALNEYCSINNADPLSSDCSIPHALTELFEFHEDIKSAIIHIPCDIDAEEFDVDYTCDANSNGRKMSESLPEPLERIPHSYLFLMQDFQPEEFAMIKKNVLFEGGQELDGALGMAGGPYGIMCNQLIDSPHGRYYTVELKEKLGALSFPELLSEGNEEALSRFVKNLSILTHETLGHVVFDMERSQERPGRLSCLKDVSLHSLANELYAYYTQAKMISFLSQRYPQIRLILEEKSNQSHAIESLMAQMDSCDPLLIDLKDEYESMEYDGLGFEARMLITYERAMKSGDWKSFKEFVVKTMSPFSQWTEIKHTIDHYRREGLSEDHDRLTHNLEKIMDSDSPEKLLIE